MLTQQGFSKMLAVVLSVHPQLKPKDDVKFVLDMWYRMFQDIPDKSLLDAASRFVMEHPKLYPGDNFVAMIRQMAKPQMIETKGDCIELAFAMVEKYGYMRDADAMKELKDRSPLVAAAVQRIAFLELCRPENSEVIRGQLRAIFDDEKARAVQLGGIVESATHLEHGLPDNEKLIGLVNQIGNKCLIGNSKGGAK